MQARHFAFNLWRMQWNRIYYNEKWTNDYASTLSIMWRTGKNYSNPMPVFILGLLRRTCNGKGAISHVVKESIQIPKGVNNDNNLRLSKKGHFSPNGSPGDLLIKVMIRPDPYFKRDGSDILTEKFITISEAVLGGTVPIKTLYGDVKIVVEKGTGHNETKKLANYVTLAFNRIGCKQTTSKSNSKGSPLCNIQNCNSKELD
jgi:hypothetical protein